MLPIWFSPLPLCQIEEDCLIVFFLFFSVWVSARIFHRLSFLRSLQPNNYWLTACLSSTRIILFQLGCFLLLFTLWLTPGHFSGIGFVFFCAWTLFIFSFISWIGHLIGLQSRLFSIGQSAACFIPFALLVSAHGVLSTVLSMRRRFLVPNKSSPKVLLPVY